MKAPLFTDNNIYIVPRLAFLETLWWFFGELDDGRVKTSQKGADHIWAVSGCFGFTWKASGGLSAGLFLSVCLWNDMLSLCRMHKHFAECLKTNTLTQVVHIILDTKIGDGYI